MRKLLALLLFVIPAAAFSQDMVPDEDNILREILNSSSENYYPSLMLRYEVGDTTLTRQNYHYLYYGFAYQDAYHPLEAIPEEARVLSLLEEQPEPDPLHAARLVAAAQEVFKRDPFSPKNINFLAYGYAMMGDTLNARVNNDRLEKILWVIGNSGTGLKESSPFHILWFAHANDYLGSRGVDVYSRMIRSNKVEYVRLAKKDGEAKGYYFNYGRMYWRKPENIEKNRKSQGFQLNGINLGRNRNTTTPAR